MWRLRFPIFVVRLIGTYFFTLFHGVAFYLGLRKFALINLLLTLVIIGLSILWSRLPNPKPEPAPALSIDLYSSSQATPIPVLIETANASLTLEEYAQKAEQKDFHSQADYVNLAILAHMAGEFDQASMYLNLARYIDPNRDFFLE